MQNRTIIRTTLDILFNNVFTKTIKSIVNFCNEFAKNQYLSLKFLEKMPIHNSVVKNENYKNKFLFTNAADYKIGTK